MLQELKERAAALKANLAALPEKDQGFAASLVRQFEKKGSLSEKQVYWLDKLADKAEGIPDFTEEKTQVEVGALNGLIALFATAAKNLKYPKIRLKTAGGLPLALSVAGPKSKAPGTVNLTDGGPYGQNVWYGRVTVAGVYEPGKAQPPEAVEDVAATLRALSRNPAKAAADYGKLTGNCCFCCKPLSDAKSTEVGYGPVCAQKWNLPWGQKKS